MPSREQHRGAHDHGRGRQLSRNLVPLRKKNLTLHGADRAGTLIEYPNNDKLNAGTRAAIVFRERDHRAQHRELDDLQHDSARRSQPRPCAARATR